MLLGAKHLDTRSPTETRPIEPVGLSKSDRTRRMATCIHQWAQSPSIEPNGWRLTRNLVLSNVWRAGGAMGGEQCGGEQWAGSNGWGSNGRGSNRPVNKRLQIPNAGEEQSAWNEVCWTTSLGHLELTSPALSGFRGLGMELDPTIRTKEGLEPRASQLLAERSNQPCCCALNAQGFEPA